MKKTLLTLCALVALLLTSCSSAVTTNVSSYVGDRGGRPIEGAKVELSGGISPSRPKPQVGSARTGIDGFYSVRHRHDSSEKFALSVRKRGYQRLCNQMFTRDEAPKGSHEVVLEQ